MRIEELIKTEPFFVWSLTDCRNRRDVKCLSMTRRNRICCVREMIKLPSFFFLEPFSNRKVIVSLIGKLVGTESLQQLRQWVDFDMDMFRFVDTSLGSRISFEHSFSCAFPDWLLDSSRQAGCCCFMFLFLVRWTMMNESRSWNYSRVNKRSIEFPLICFCCCIIRHQTEIKFQAVGSGNDSADVLESGKSEGCGTWKSCG